MSDSGRTQKPSSTALPQRAAQANANANPALPANAPAREELFGAARGRVVDRDRADAASQIGRTLTAWRKATGPAARGAGAIPEAGGSLDGGVRGKMEQAIGTGLGDVRVGTGADSAAAASSMNARAFTVGNNVHFGSGQYAPGTREGDTLIAHELTHVVQGKQSGVRRKATGAGGEHDHGHEVSDPAEPAEKEADTMAEHVADKLHGGAKGAGAKPGGGREKAPPIAAKLDGVGRKIYRNKDDHNTAPKTTTPPKPEGKKTNPDFDKDAIAFETALGGKAMAHGASNAAASTLINKCRDMVKMIALKGHEGAEKQKEYEAAFNQKLSEMMGNAPLPKNQGIAGAVGDDVAIINEVFAEGNLRERMTILFNFMRPFSNTLVQADVADREKFIQQLNLDGATIRARLDTMKTNSKAQLVGDPTQKVVNMQNESREDAGDKTSSRQAGALPKGAELSKREVKFQGLQAKPDGSLDQTVQQTLKWKEGADKWRAKESSDYAQKLHSLKLPFGAGPSGTTDRIMSMAQLLGYGEVYSTRLACIGYLLPIRAHSLHEILTAAATYGCDFTDGQQMYHNIKPLGDTDLKACGGGKFPDEPKPDAPTPTTTHK